MEQSRIHLAVLKLRYGEKATKFEKVFNLILTLLGKGTFTNYVDQKRHSTKMLTFWLTFIR